jgi:uncharacterized phage infection (PIP) family protein YhgE
MVWECTQKRFWFIAALLAGLSACPLFSGACMGNHFAEVGGATSFATPVNQDNSSDSAAKMKETIQSLRSLIAKIAAAKNDVEQQLHSASRPGQDVVKQYEQLGEQQKEFEGQVKELCGLLAAMDPSEKEDRCVAGDTK